MKAAETDATKRALMTFGNAFGLSLYGPMKEQMPKPAMVQTRTKPESSEHRDIPASAAAIAKAKQEQMVNPPASMIAREDRPVAAAAFQPNYKIDKSVLAISEPRRLRDPEHLRFVASKGCLVCGKNRAQAHHLRFTQPSAMAKKVSDEFTVPLCSEHHRDLHRHGDEQGWWRLKAIDAVAIATKLWAESQRRAFAPSARQASG